VSGGNSTPLANHRLLISDEFALAHEHVPLDARNPRATTEDSSHRHYRAGCHCWLAPILVHGGGVSSPLPVVQDDQLS
jgi:hypothetical protein